jgi:hypothetical protein
MRIQFARFKLNQESRNYPVCSHNLSSDHFFKNSLTALNWPRFVKGILVLIFGQDSQINQFVESLHFRPNLGRLDLFGRVEETSRGPSSPINDRVHGSAARGTINSSIAKCFMFPISWKIASIAARRSANRTAANDFRLRSKEHGCPIGRASGRIPVCQKSCMPLKTRGFQALSAAAI